MSNDELEVTSTDPFSMTPVESGNLSEVGFNPLTQQGRIRFQSGGLYEYDACTQEEADNIRNAPSPNDAFTALWRGSKPFRKIM